MTTRRLTATICFAAVALLTTMQCASAARLYNFLNFPVVARGTGTLTSRHDVQIAPGQRSDSLGWSQVTSLEIIDPKRGATICGFNWWPHAEVQGGNYLVMSMRDNRVSCVMCNASHRVTHVSVSTLPYRDPYTSAQHGC